MDQNIYIITFESTHAALASSKTLKTQGVQHYLIPTPREISAGCGMALRLNASEQTIATIWNALITSDFPTQEFSLNLQLGDSEYLAVEL